MSSYCIITSLFTSVRLLYNTKYVCSLSMKGKIFIGYRWSCWYRRCSLPRSQTLTSLFGFAAKRNYTRVLHYTYIGWWHFYDFSLQGNWRCLIGGAPSANRMPIVLIQFCLVKAQPLVLPLEHSWSQDFNYLAQDIHVENEMGWSRDCPPKKNLRHRDELHLILSFVLVFWQQFPDVWLHLMTNSCTSLEVWML